MPPRSSSPPLREEDDASPLKPPRPSAVRAEEQKKKAAPPPAPASSVNENGCPQVALRSAPPTAARKKNDATTELSQVTLKPATTRREAKAAKAAAQELATEKKTGVSPTREEKLRLHRDEHERRRRKEKDHDDADFKEEECATVREEHDAETLDELSVNIGDVVTVKLSKGHWTFCESSGEERRWVLVQKGTEQGLVPASKLGRGKMHLKAGKGRRGAGDAQKASAKYDPMAEALAQHWIEQVTGHVFRGAFADELTDGTVLCRLAQKIEPTSITKKIYDGKVQFLQMDNIATFLKAVSSFGVPQRDQFETVDLYECRDLNLVVNCLFALSQHIMKHPEKFPSFPGPFLKPAEDTDPAVLSSLKLIVAVNEYRDRQWHHSKIPEEDDDDGTNGGTNGADDDDKRKRPPSEDDKVKEAIAYRLGILGLKERQKEDPDCKARAVDRNDFAPAFLVLYSTSTKHERHIEYEERRTADLLAAKKKRYELVYVDVAPERKADLALACEGAGKPVQLPALVFGGEYVGDLSLLQEYEDAGALDDLLEPAEEGKGFWCVPDAWSQTSSCLDGGGFKIVNDV